VDGGNLVLTIDETIQYTTERELDKIVQSYHPKNAAAIVMDPKTGEILAMASRPTFDPNNYNAVPASNRRDFAINDAYEPGSTMKTITAAAAMEENIVNRNTMFYCPGSIKVGQETISCMEAHGSQTFAQAVENSCNVSFVKIGLALGMDKYYQYLNAFGFGQLTGIDLPGEATGILVPQASAKQIDLATMAFGQANAVTPIQLTTAVAAIANGGKLMKPHLLKQVLDGDGKVVQTNQPVMVRQVISANTAKELCDILQGEVTNGTGKNAYIEGYNVGGKTGTAQKIAPGGGYMEDEYVGSFIGLAPADDPRLVVLVVVDAPQGAYYGGTVAAPAVREILNDSLRYMGVPLRSTVDKKTPVQDEQVVVPDVVNLSRTEAVAKLQAEGFKVQANGTGTIVWQQTPRAESKLSRGSQVSISMAAFDKGKPDGKITVPDLQGKSMKEADSILAELGLNLFPDGYGISCEQSPAAGQVIVSGSNVKVRFQPLSQ
jgi:stage V sporulation protein D (sporulation-specific penicillin-binding protein)